MSWHGQYCPAWKAQQEIAAEREEEQQQDKDSAEWPDHAFLNPYALSLVPYASALFR